MFLRPRLRSVLTVTLLLVSGVAIDTGSVAGSPDDEIREFVAELQAIPAGELPRADLEIEPRALTPWWITRDEAIEDAERFFYLLRHGWCGYGFFRGGVESGDREGDPFVEAQRALLARLSEKERWSPGALAQRIHEQLAFVNDCHLRLNDEPFCQRQEFWFDPQLELREEHGDFQFTLDGETYRLIAVDGAEPTTHLFPSINAAGEAIHLLGSLSTAEPVPLLLTAWRAEQQIRLQRSLARSEFHPREKFADDRIGGIPVVRVRSFADYYGRELQAIVDRAESYRGEPYVILDIRGNGGGNTIWPRMWIQAFTGGSPSLKQALTELVSRTSMVGRANLFALLLNSYRGQERQAVQVDFERFQVEAARFDDPSVTPHWSGIYLPPIDPIPNPTTLIVIQDRKVASAGEGAISYLMDQVENVVFVGENTMGALTFGQVSVHRLPHSKLLFYVPIKLNVPLDLQIREAQGYAPDYWVPARQALNHAVAAARAGTIPTHLPLPAAQFDVEFVPERTLPSWFPPQRDLVFGLLFLTMGAVTIIANRKRGHVFFLFASLLAFALGAGYVIFKSPAGYVLGVVGLLLAAIGLAKRSRQN